MKVVIERFRTQYNCDKQTVGILFVVDQLNRIIYKCFTIELPDFGNKKKTSNIPVGEYDVVKRTSVKYGNHFHILNVPNRDFILIHHGNYFTQTEGCVLVGNDLTDINKDGIVDVINSQSTMTHLNRILSDKFKLEIK